MRKIILFIAAVMVAVAVHAQKHESEVNEDIYVSLSAGGVTPTTNVHFGNKFEHVGTRPMFNLEAGKKFNSWYTQGINAGTSINTTGVKTAFDKVHIMWMHKVNALGWTHKNTFVNAIAGAGWGHNMVTSNNYGVFQTGLEVGTNINKNWGVFVKPAITWEYANMGLNVNNSDISLQIGVVYNFNKKAALCNTPTLQGKYDALLNDYNKVLDDVNALRAELNSQYYLNNNLQKKIAAHKCPVTISTNTVSIGFKCNSDEVADTYAATLYQIVENAGGKQITVNGYADANTGNPEYNMALSKRRAEVIKKHLIEMGAKDVVINYYGDTVQPFADNDLNRVVIVTE